MLTTLEGKPVEFLIKPGSMHDAKAFRDMRLQLPRTSIVYADSAYLNCKIENELFRNEKILLLAQRRSNTKHPMPKATEKRRKKKRKSENIKESIQQLEEIKKHHEGETRFQKHGYDEIVNALTKASNK